MGKKAAQHDFREQAAGGSLYMGACEWVLPEPRVRTRLDCRSRDSRARRSAGVIRQQRAFSVPFVWNRKAECGWYRGF